MNAERIRWSDTVREGHFQALARPSGRFAMVAMDQRVSLENIFADAGLEPTTDTLDAFRSNVTTTLATHASAVLLDSGFMTRNASQRPWSRVQALIVAADHLMQEPGQPAHDSRFDARAAGVAMAHGAVALKLLVLWYPGESNDERLRSVEEFVESAHAHGLLAIVEGIVKWNRAAGREQATADEFLEAGQALAASADLYKAQIPVNAGEDALDVERLSRQLTAAIPCPWVVLSTGVAPHRFAELLASACRGGASGFLAGRAIWRKAVSALDPRAALTEHAAVFMDELAAIVDAEGRAWDEVPDPAGRSANGAA